MCNHHVRYVDLNIDLSRFKISYCDVQSVVFTHVLDTADYTLMRSSYVAIYSDGAWMGGNIGVNLYIDGRNIHAEQLDQALLELDKHFSKQK